MTLKQNIRACIFRYVKFWDRDEHGPFSEEPNTVCGIVLRLCHVLANKSAGVHAPTWWRDTKHFVIKTHTDQRNNCIKTMHIRFNGKCWGACRLLLHVSHMLLVRLKKKMSKPLMRQHRARLVLFYLAITYREGQTASSIYWDYATTRATTFSSLTRSHHVWWANLFGIMTPTWNAYVLLLHNTNLRPCFLLVTKRLYCFWSIIMPNDGLPKPSCKNRW